jgi:hypothetical protein
MRLALAIAAAAILGFAADSVSAAGPRHWRFPGAPNKQAAIGAYGKAVYPKYRSDFHIREFENLGLPHGDIGTSQGNGITRLPW